MVVVRHTPPHIPTVTQQQLYDGRGVCSWRTVSPWTELTLPLSMVMY